MDRDGVAKLRLVFTGNFLSNINLHLGGKDSQGKNKEESGGLDELGEHRVVAR